MHINLHIERLILDGLPLTRAQGALVQAAVEAELARLLAERGLASGLQTDGALLHVPTGGLQLTTGSTPASMGEQIAQSLYGGIGQSDKAKS